MRWGFALFALGLAFLLASCELLTPNKPPQASFDFTPKEGPAPLTVSFDGSASTDHDGQIVSFKWDFGDGSQETGPTVTHEYTQPGIYVAALTVTDNRGGRSSAQGTVTAQAKTPPRERTDTTQNDVLRFERTVVATPKAGETFLVSVVLTAKRELSIVLLEEKLPAQLTLVEGSLKKAELSAVAIGDRVTLQYRVRAGSALGSFAISGTALAVPSGAGAPPNKLALESTIKIE